MNVELPFNADDAYFLLGKCVENNCSLADYLISLVEKERNENREEVELEDLLEEPIPDSYYKQMCKSSYKYEKYGYTYYDEDEEDDLNQFDDL